MSDLNKFTTSDLMGEIKRRLSCASKPEKRIVLLGAPGSGKGTQAAQIQKDYCLCHLSTGDMLREAITNKTDLGAQAKAAMDDGKLVSDSIVVGLIEEKLTAPECRRGALFDGFPRNAEQAQLLEASLSKKNVGIDAVINLEVPDDLLVKRVCGRRVHPASGRTYHTSFAPPKVTGKDDITGDALIQRKDDNEETLRKRLMTFKQSTQPLINFYGQKGICHTINGNQGSRDVTRAVFKAIDPKATPSMDAN